MNLVDFHRFDSDANHGKLSEMQTAQRTREINFFMLCIVWIFQRPCTVELQHRFKKDCSFFARKGKAHLLEKRREAKKIPHELQKSSKTNKKDLLFVA